MRTLWTIILTLSLVMAYGDDDDITTEPSNTRYASFLDRAGDIPMGHQFVPSKKKPQGEIQLLKRGRAWVVQSIFYTKYPTRFLKEVRKKEAKAWPKKGAVGKIDSDRYLESLAKAIETIKATYAKDKPTDKRRKLLVELVFAPLHGFALFSEVILEKKDDRETIKSTTLLSILPLSQGYLRREMALICEDSFKYSAQTCAEIFRTFPEPISIGDTP